MTSIPKAISDIDDPEKIRVTLYASNQPVHAPLVEVVEAGAVGRLLPPGGEDGDVLTKDGASDYSVKWSSGGDMLSSIYDPQNIAADAFDRANHTGSQAISTVTGLQAALDAKLDDSQAGTTGLALLAAETAADARNTIGANDASNINAGTLDDARLPTTQAGRTFTSAVTVQGDLTVNSDDLILKRPGASGNVKFFIRDENNVDKAALYWNEAAGLIRIETYKPDGSGLQSYIDLGISSEFFRYRNQTVWHRGNLGSTVYHTTTANSANVNVVSNGRLARSTSSRKYKTDIEALEPEYRDTIMRMRPVWYRSTCKADNPDWSYYGLIAEEVAELDPRLVHWRVEGVREVERETVDAEGNTATETVQERYALDQPEPEGVMYERIVPHLIAKIQDQQRQIDELRKILTEPA